MTIALALMLFFVGIVAIFGLMTFGWGRPVPIALQVILVLLLILAATTSIFVGYGLMAYGMTLN